MDFFQIEERIVNKVGRPRKETEEGGPWKNEPERLDVYPRFNVCPSKDLMIRGKAFYAIWDEEKGLWSTDEYDVARLVDKELSEFVKGRAYPETAKVYVRRMADFSSKSWIEYKNYLSKASDANRQLDERLTFSNSVVKKSDYASKRLNYPLEEGTCEAYNEIIGTLYEPDERAKLEWAIGSIVSGDSRDIQKFIVLYGEAGAGKSTILNIIQKLFEGYYTTFEAKTLTSANNVFSTEVFRSNPLVGIQHDGDLSKIEDNSKLNSIVSHEEMTMNEKFKSSYTARTNCFLFMATNRPVKITDAKSGIIRRLIDVTPSGRKLLPKRYYELMARIDFELGAIASHCLNVYREMGKNYYSSYKPLSMIFQTDVFFNFVEANYDVFADENGITLSRAYDLYKCYCDDSLVEFKLPRYKFREELKNYFKSFSDITRVNGLQVRSYYSGFLKDKFVSDMQPKETQKEDESTVPTLVLGCTASIFDKECANCRAQYASDKGTPMQKWAEVTTKLSDLDTTRTHYVQVPENLITIDFDLKDENGNKSAKLNLEAASKWPMTYAEYSNGGAGIHLQYYYDGDAARLSRLYADGIEVKVSVGDSALRRRLSKCNNVPIATINSGLPLKEEKMVNAEAVKSEKKLRDLINQNLRKEIHPGTKPSVDFILKILDDAYASGLNYDVSDMRQKILIFANNSTHQADACIRMVGKMKFKSEERSEPAEVHRLALTHSEPAFFDVEVFPNLFLVNWKFPGPDAKCVRMINPTPAEVWELMKLPLIGFNCLRYDNTILYARYLGKTNEELYQLSQRIIKEGTKALIREAENVSYTDVYDFASAGNKKSLKKFEIELGIHHQELGLPWDKPVPEDQWEKVAQYCDNDVIATEAVFNYLKGDWVARQILAELSGLSVNDTTNRHSARIVFGTNRKPQSQFVYTDLSEMFPGYTFKNGKSLYRGEDPKEGGYVYAEPGIYYDVALLDVASMHPTSIEQLNLLGPYTKTYSDMKKSRLAIKHNDRESLATLLDGKLLPFMERADAGEFKSSDLSTALKTALNSAYGLTFADNNNPFRDPRNIDNIVAKRGALFMIDLKHEVQDRGFTVAHIKTDSIKIPNATPEIIQFAMEFGQKYGYTFEHEATYERMCLVNDAVYIARYSKDHPKHPLEWTATGAQFAQPYVFKTLFSKEAILFKDKCETKTVSSALYLDMNEPLGEEEHDYRFVGKAGQFCPILPGHGGGILVREKEGKYYAATGTKGYRWLESETVQLLGLEEDIDLGYYRGLVDTAVKTIGKYGDFEVFMTDDNVLSTKEELPNFDK